MTIKLALFSNLGFVWLPMVLCLFSPRLGLDPQALELALSLPIAINRNDQSFFSQDKLPQISFMGYGADGIPLKINQTIKLEPIICSSGQESPTLLSMEQAVSIGDAFILIEGVDGGSIQFPVRIVQDEEYDRRTDLKLARTTAETLGITDLISIIYFTSQFKSAMVQFESQEKACQSSLIVTTNSPAVSSSQNGNNIADPQIEDGDSETDRIEDDLIEWKPPCCRCNCTCTFSNLTATPNPANTSTAVPTTGSTLSIATAAQAALYTASFLFASVVLTKVVEIYLACRAERHALKKIEVEGQLALQKVRVEESCKQQTLKLQNEHEILKALANETMKDNRTRIVDQDLIRAIRIIRYQVNPGSDEEFLKFLILIIILLPWLRNRNI